MRGDKKTDPKGKEKTNIFIDQDPGDNLPDPDINLEDNKTDMVGEDDLDEFYETDSDDIKIQIYRLEPKTYKNIDISGFLGYLQNGENLGDIQAKYGGGRYSIRRLERGRFTLQRTVRISGAPLVADDPPPATVGTINPPETVGNPNGKTFQGIPLDGSNAEFLRMMERIAAIKAMMAPPPDINTDLVRILISRDHKDNSNDLTSSLTQLEKLKSLMESFKADHQSGNSGPSWLPLVEKTLETVGSLLKARATQPSSPGIQTAPPPEITHNQAGNPTGYIPEMTNKTEEIDQVNIINVIAEKCAGYIVAGYLAEPRQSEDQTAQVVKAVLPPGFNKYSELIKGQKETLYTIAKNLLSQEIDADQSEYETFRLFFDKTFYILLDEG